MTMNVNGKSVTVIINYIGTELFKTVQILTQNQNQRTLKIYIASSTAFKNHCQANPDVKAA